MKIKRIGVGLAALAAAAIALAGCSGSNGGGGGANPEVNTSNQPISIAQNGLFTSANPNTSNNYTTYNSNVAYFTNSSFNYYNGTPALVKNTKFGTYKVLSQNPLEINYTVNKGVKWSDGDQVGAADLLLAWATFQPQYNDSKGVNFGSVSAGALPLATTPPKVIEDNRGITLVYAKPYVDWEQLAFGIGLPAHAVYNLAFPGKAANAAAADKAVITAVENNDTATLSAMAKVWNTGFDFNGNSLPTNKELYLSNGPYVISAYTKGQSVTLTRNKLDTWDPTPHFGTVTIRFISDPTAEVQALQNGEVSIIQGQADADTVSALKALNNVTTKTESGSTYEHVDLTFSNEAAPNGGTNPGVTPGPFDPKSYGGDANKAKLVREAFLLALPRQQIVTNLIKPINPDATLDNSQVFLPGNPGYSESVAQNGSAMYADAGSPASIAKAKQLLQQAGVTAPKVRFLYDNTNTRRQQEFALIKSAETQAGFNIVDDGNAQWGSILGNGSYDASLFAWQFTSLAVTGSQQTMITGGGNNFSGYSNSTVDSSFTSLQSEFNTATQKTLLATIDKQLWSDAYGATIFQFPDVVASASTLKNVSYSPLAPNQFWNFWEWTK